FLRDLCVLCGETPGFPVTAITCVLADEFAFPITGSPDESVLPFRSRRSRCDHGDSPGVPGYFDRFVESKRLLTNRPLRHAEISTGSPRLFHWVTQGFAWVTQASPVFPDQQRVSLCSAALWLNADGCLLSASFQIPSRLSA